MYLNFTPQKELIEILKEGRVSQINDKKFNKEDLCTHKIA